jgi:hypothetical protein
MLLHSRVSDATRSGGGSAGLFRARLWHQATVPTALCAGVAVSILAAGLIRGWEPRAVEQDTSEPLQAAGLSTGYNLWNASPYILTLLVMIATCPIKRSLIGAPGALGKSS